MTSGYFACASSEAGQKGAKAGGGGEDDELSPSKLDIRVGKIVSVEKVNQLMADNLSDL